MRTAILMGCFCIADAIRIDWFPKDGSSIKFIVTLFLLFFIFDILEFTNKMKRKS